MAALYVHLSMQGGRLMRKQCAGYGLIFWLPALFLALGPTASAANDSGVAGV